MKKINQIFVLLIVTLAWPVILTAYPVNSFSTITGNKIVKTQDRTVSSFQAIKVSGGIDVELSQGNTLKLQVEADENLIALIRTEVKDGVLNIYPSESIRDAKTLKIHLTFQQMDAITASGGCDIESMQKLSFATLKVDLSGGCDIELSCKADKLVCKQSGGCDAKFIGEAETGNFDVSGGCDVDAKELKLRNCTVDATGGSDVSIYATGELTLKASGASDISYYGKPAKVIKNATGSSDIRAE